MDVRTSAGTGSCWMPTCDVMECAQTWAHVLSRAAVTLPGIAIPWGGISEFTTTVNDHTLARCAESILRPSINWTFIVFATRRKSPLAVLTVTMHPMWSCTEAALWKTSSGWKVQFWLSKRPNKDLQGLSFFRDHWVRFKAWNDVPYSTVCKSWKNSN